MALLVTVKISKMGQLLIRIRQLLSRLVLFMILCNLFETIYSVGDLFDLISIKILNLLQVFGPLIYAFQGNYFCYTLKWLRRAFLVRQSFTLRRNIELKLLFGVLDGLMYLIKSPFVLTFKTLKLILNSYFFLPFVEKCTILFNKCKWAYNYNMQSGGLIIGAQNFYFVSYLLLKYLPSKIYETDLFGEFVQRFFTFIGTHITYMIAFPFLYLGYLSGALGIRNGNYYAFLENIVLAIYQPLYYFDSTFMTLMLVATLFAKVFTLLEAIVNAWVRYYPPNKAHGGGMNPYKNPLVYMFVEQYEKFLDTLRWPMFSNRERTGPLEKKIYFNENTRGPKIKIGKYYYKLVWAGPSEYDRAIFSSNAEWPFPVRVSPDSPDYKWYQFVVGYLNQHFCWQYRRAFVGFIISQTIFSITAYIEMGGMFQQPF